MQLGDADGVGVVLPPGITGLDLDDVRRSDGSLTMTGELLSARFRTYAEVSPSGRGVKFLMSGHLDPELPKVRNEQGIELYEGSDEGNRYFTLTGHTLSADHTEIQGHRSGIHFVQSMLAEPLREIRIGDKTDEIGSPDEQRERAVAAVRALGSAEATPRQIWRDVGFSLHSIDSSEEFFSLWVEFSRKCSEKFPGVDELRQMWEKMREDRQRQIIGPGTLFHFARKAGWRDTTEYQTGAVSVADFDVQEIDREYAVADFMTVGASLLVGGPPKSLKTSVSLDLAVSLASGTPFLNHFSVPARRRVMMISGESGEKTTQEALRLIAQARDITPADLTEMLISFRLPKLDDLSHVNSLIRELRNRETEIVIIDPLYRSLRAGDAASNVYAMGERLELIAERIHRAGITVILNHHFRKQGKTWSDPPELEDLSQSGVAEFGRQFCLLKRREQYKRDGTHRLWFNWGGSAGHQGTKILEVVTGTRKRGLCWQVRMMNPEEYKEAKKERDEFEKADREDSVRLDVLRFVAENPGATQREIREGIRGRNTAIQGVLELLIEAGEIDVKEGPNRSRFHTVPPHADAP